MDEKIQPLVLAFVGDLYFSMRIESVGKAVGCRVEVIESADQFIGAAGAGNRSSAGPVDGGEPGLSLRLTRTLVERAPVMLIFDLDFAPIPALEWIPVVKSNPGTAGFKVVAFGSHVNKDQHRAARQAGADHVLAKSRFVQILPQLLTRLAGDGQPEGKTGPGDRGS